MHMKNTLLLKALTLVFALGILAACSSTETQDSGADDAAAAQAMADQEAADRAAAEAAARAAKDQATTGLGSVVYFEFDEADLRAEAKATLDGWIAVLNNSTQNVRLEGHADERGTREYNMALGERRANAVANYLVVNGIPRYRIESVSYGEERPVGFGHDDSSWSQNRRVEIKAN